MKVTPLLNLHNINVINTEPENKMPVCVWLDMDLYKRFLKLPYLDPQLYNGKCIESPGQFHTVLCALRCMGQTVESSGLDQAWVLAQIINGKHHNRATDCHQFTLHVLSDLLFDAFFEKHPHAYEALETSLQNLTHACSGKHTVGKAHQQLKSAMLAADFQKLMDEFDAANEKYPCISRHGCTCGKSLICFNSSEAHVRGSGTYIWPLWNSCAFRSVPTIDWTTHRIFQNI